MKHDALTIVFPLFLGECMYLKHSVQDNELVFNLKCLYYVPIPNHQLDSD